MQAATAQVQNK